MSSSAARRARSGLIRRKPQPLDPVKSHREAHGAMLQQASFGESRKPAMPVDAFQEERSVQFKPLPKPPRLGLIPGGTVVDSQCLEPVRLAPALRWIPQRQKPGSSSACENARRSGDAGDDWASCWLLLLPLPPRSLFPRQELLAISSFGSCSSVACSSSARLRLRRINSTAPPNLPGPTRKTPKPPNLMRRLASRPLQQPKEASIHTVANQSAIAARRLTGSMMDASRIPAAVVLAPFLDYSIAASCLACQRCLRTRSPPSHPSPAAPTPPRPLGAPPRSIHHHSPRTGPSPCPSRPSLEKRLRIRLQCDHTAHCWWVLARTRARNPRFAILLLPHDSVTHAASPSVRAPTTLLVVPDFLRCHSIHFLSSPGLWTCTRPGPIADFLPRACDDQTRPQIRSQERQIPNHAKSTFARSLHRSLSLT
ncbi:hypothetical protein AXG93_872s1130 [Marchantia polymorpha subsp. ruderalis]|uniref:Uncharacterized protein n=1 Tax=Marchantia polymorpha subsp. ruderalis TaxID=1480154 RepID=A0A176VJP8_MARPO|nr:hypothetical protein AXG93_872s1130 [Marchantia polymorpha subsp. ruderalis]